LILEALQPCLRTLQIRVARRSLVLQVFDKILCSAALCIDCTDFILARLYIFKGVGKRRRALAEILKSQGGNALYVHFLYKVTVERTFENAHPARRRGTFFCVRVDV
jgi:hypothetical protein